MGILISACHEKRSYQTNKRKEDPASAEDPRYPLHRLPTSGEQDYEQDKRQEQPEAQSA